MVFVALHEEMRYAYDFAVARGGRCLRPYDTSADNYTFDWTLSGRGSVSVDFAVIGGAGNLRTALTVAGELHASDVSACFLVGLAGSLDRDRIKLGDVLIATDAKVYYADKVKRCDPAVEAFEAPSGTYVAGTRPISVDERARYLGDSFFRYRRDAVQWKASQSKMYNYMYHCSKVRPLPLQAVDQSNFKDLPASLANALPALHSGVILGSEMVVDSEEYIEYLRNINTDDSHDYYLLKHGSQPADRHSWLNTPLSAVDMETFGFFQAVGRFCSPTSTHAFSVRGISDVASEKESLDEGTGDGVRTVAVQNAIAVTLDMVDYIVRTTRGI